MHQRGRKEIRVKKEKVNNFNEGMISVLPPFLSRRAQGKLAGLEYGLLSPAAHHNLLPSEHLSSLLHLYIYEPEGGKEKKWRQGGKKTLIKAEEYIKASCFITLSYIEIPNGVNVMLIRTLDFSSFSE